MAILTRADIRRCNRTDWVPRSPINSGDYECIIESAHTMWERIGTTVPGLYGDWRTTSTTYTQTTTTPDPDLDTWEGGGRLYRIIDNFGVDSVSIRLSAILKDCSLRLTVGRRDADGTETSLGTQVVTSTSTSLEQASNISIYTDSGTSEGGVAANDPAIIYYTVDFKHEAVGAEARLQSWHIGEFNDVGAYFPTG